MTLTRSFFLTSVWQRCVCGGVCTGYDSIVYGERFLPQPTAKTHLRKNVECLCPGPCPTLKMCVSCTRNLCFTNATRASKTMKLILKATLLDLTLAPTVVKLHKTVCETMRPHMCSHCVHTVFTLCPPIITFDLQVHTIFLV